MRKKNKLLKYFYLSFFGGEPLIYFQQAVAPLLEGASKIFKDSGILFGAGFTTNGYLITQDKIKFFKKHSVTDFQITLDGNKEFHNKVRYINSSKGSYEKIISNIKLLARNKFNVIMRINFTGDNLTSCLDIPNDFLDLENKFKEYITVDFQQVWQDSKPCYSHQPHTCIIRFYTGWI